MVFPRQKLVNKFLWSGRDIATLGSRFKGIRIHFKEGMVLFLVPLFKASFRHSNKLWYKIFSILQARQYRFLLFFTEDTVVDVLPR